MALYSVWDWNRNSWRVYETRAPASVGDDPVPPRPAAVSVLGADPDCSVKPLPSGAKFVGQSHMARGEIRRASRGMGDVGDDAGRRAGVLGNGPLMFVGGVAAALAVSWWWKKRKRTHR